MEWLSGRRRSQQSPAAALAAFDTSVLQIRDWLSAEQEMLRAQPVAVGDYDEIMQHLDKQKVSVLLHLLHLLYPLSANGTSCHLRNIA
ncbi:unnamed protein product [Plutella xylostella]|uniref:(diamondback moth) hypothetical protein n=1 Tax=Plutella xylostella TaxID=51655 RepID=A0A8S4G955_PLUXY|nr:unnamed protein product [Plutella xylostella]